MSTTPNEQSAERAMFDALHNDGFKREEDWFVKNEGEEFMEQIHVDTIAMVARAALSGKKK